MHLRMLNIRVGAFFKEEFDGRNTAILNGTEERVHRGDVVNIHVVLVQKERNDVVTSLQINSKRMMNLVTFPAAIISGVKSDSF